MYWKSYPKRTYENLVRDETLIPRIDRILALERLYGTDRSTLESLKAFWDKRKGFTPGQASFFSNIEKRYADAFDPEKVAAKQAASAAWEASWNAEKKEDYAIAIAYYAIAANSFPVQDVQNFYFKIVAQHQADPDAIPSESLYNKIVLNKYAQKVLAATEAQPVFELGSYVMLRSTYFGRARGKDWAVRTDDVFIVVDNNGQVISAAAGAKPYRLLKLGTDKLIDTEERFIRKISKKAGIV